MDFEPHFKNKAGTRSTHHYRDLILRDKKYVPLVGALLNSSLFFFWFCCFSNVRNVSRRDVETFPFNIKGVCSDVGISQGLSADFHSLVTDYRLHSERKTRSQKGDTVVYDEFYPAYSKPIMDQIDRVLAKHYGFTDEETDFIINYDIKYRLGRAGEESEGD